MASDRPSFVYTIYIAATPEQVFSAIQDPEMTKLYWGRHRNASAWTPGARWEHQDFDDPNTVDIVGTVLECDPPHKLVVSWALPAEAEDPAKCSRVTFDIAPWEGSVRLTVSHDELAPDSVMLKSISMGWPAVLSSLKSLLETGRQFPGTDRRWSGGKSENA